MPGLIDAHIHVVLTEVNIRLLSDVPLTLAAAQASVSMRAMLMRGFTTLRDTGGADWASRRRWSRVCSWDRGCSLRGRH